MKHLLSVLAATVLATAAGLGFLGFGAATLEEAAAAGGGYVRTCAGGSIYLNDYEKRTLDLHNWTRAQNGLARLCVHPTLMAAARSHSLEMIDRGYFSHNSYNGEPYDARLERFGYYPHRHVAENISWGSGSRGAPAGIFEGWMNSSWHRSNILNANLKEIGVGTAYGRYAGYGGTTMYTVAFGTR